MECRAKVVVGLVWQMGHQLVHVQPCLGSVFITDFKGLVVRCWVMEGFEADVCHVCTADALSDAIALQNTGETT